jgi:hypothetical protein
MRRSLQFSVALLCAVLLALALPASAATPTTQQHLANNSSANGTTIAKTMAAVSAHDAIVAWCLSGLQNDTLSVSDGTNGSYTEITGSKVSTAAQGTLEAFYFKDSAAFTPTVTCTTGNTNFRSIWVWVIRGQTTGTPLDIVSARTTSGTTVTTANFTTAFKNELILAAVSCTSTCSAGSGWTNGLADSPSGDLAEDKSLTSIQTTSASFSQSTNAAAIVSAVGFTDGLVDYTRNISDSVTSSLTVKACDGKHPCPGDGASFTDVITRGFTRNIADSATVVPNLGEVRDPQINWPQGWTTLSNTSLINVAPANGFNGDAYQFTANFAGIFNAWNGAIWDNSDGFLTIFGGGHTDYAGNEVYRIKLNARTGTDGTPTPTPVRVKDPDTPTTNGSGTCTETLASGADPNSRHMYDGYGFDPTRHQMLITGDSLTASSGSCTSNHIWILDLNTLTWSDKGALLPTGGQGKLVAYNAADDRYYIHNAKDLLVYDPKLGTVTSLTGTNGSDLNPGSSTGLPYLKAVIDPDDKVFFILGTAPGVGLVSKYIDISSGSSYTLQTATLTSCSGISSLSNFGMVWNPDTKKIVAYPHNGDTIYVLDWSTKTCTTHTFTGGPSANALSNGVLGRFQYMPQQKAYIVCTDVNANCRVLNDSTQNANGAGGTVTTTFQTSPAVSAVKNAGGTNNPVALSDSIQSAPAVTAVANHPIALSASLQSSPAITATAGRSAAISESVQTSPSLNASRGPSAVPSDSFQTSPAVAVQASHGLAIADSAQLSPGVTDNAAHSATIAESVTASPAVSALASHAAALSDGVQNAPSLTAQAAHQAALSESFQSQPLVTAGPAHSPNITEQLTASDSLSAIVGHPGTRRRVVVLGGM